jgi:centrosomal protein CEP290
VLLLEAYEQLEADVGQEVDRALAKQTDELARLARRVQFLEGHLEAERRQVALLGEEGAKLEGRLADSSAKNAQYESGVYGLPQVGALHELQVLRSGAMLHQKTLACLRVEPHLKLVMAAECCCSYGWRVAVHGSCVIK